MRQTVRFADGVQTLRQEGVSRFLEVGPDAVLAALVEDGIAVARKGRDEAETLMAAVGRAYTRGWAPDWAKVFGAAATVELPTYPFQRERYWLDSYRRAAPATGGWSYREEWRSAPTGPDRIAGRWLVVGGPALAEALAGGRANPVLVAPTTDRALLAERLRAAAGPGP
ncbi:hypothetical protein, partial [Dactylosporangium matsuzakiense]